MAFGCHKKKSLWREGLYYLFFMSGVQRFNGFWLVSKKLIASTLCPNARLYFIASHNSVEPGHNIGLSAMGLKPLFDLEMRLGEGNGDTLAMPIIEAAAKCLAEMSTFAEAGVSGKEDD